jgi:phosphate:Na+ symporter
MTGQIIGGLGLFLMGMWLMTEGLKSAAGNALKDILSSWTSSPPRGIATGFALTSLVQSSSAVTVATIGFANAGLISLTHAIWVIYGSNLGTTMTGWLVSLLGFKLDIGLYALPFIGIGMALRLTSARSSRAAIGQAVAGFGLLFLGIDTLKDGFDLLSTEVALPQPGGSELLTRLAYAGIGMAVTVLMQSSSASMVVALSAVTSGLATPTLAAAMVIGANLGTTTTAMLACWGATPTAKRVAAAHVIFNLLTALVAFVMLPQLVAWIAEATEALGFDPNPAIRLALFHTIFNVTGLLLIWPLTPRLILFLKHQFRSRTEDAGKPVYLDKNVLQVPSVALEAAAKETGRLRDITITGIRRWIDDPASDAPLRQARLEARNLSEAIAAFLARLSGGELTPDEVRKTQTLMRVLQHYLAALEDAANSYSRLSETTQAPSERYAMQREIRSVIARPEQMTGQTADRLRDLRERMKDRMLQKTASREISIDTFDNTLRGMNSELRMLRHLRKGSRYLETINDPEAAVDPA